MKRIVYNILCVSLLVAATTSCEKWLDKTPASEVRAEELFSNAYGFQQALTGCYIGMADLSLYGQNASWLYPEVLAHQCDRFVQESQNSFWDYEYNSVRSKPIIEGIWAKAYNVIVNANEALLYIDKNQDALDPIEHDILKGEFLAIRAYVQFDLMRLYGYGDWYNRKSEIDAKMAVPYVTSVDKNTTAQVSTREFFGLLTGDLEQAASLLKDSDPISSGKPWSTYALMNDGGYYDYRNLHLNYYAVKALQSRVYLWEGSPESKQKALEAAGEVIDGFLSSSGTIGDKNIWRWMKSDDVSKYPAMVFEHLFGLSTPTLKADIRESYDVNYTLLDPALRFSSDKYYEIYESSQTDWRSQSGLCEQGAQLDGAYVSKKLFQPDTDHPYTERVPMIRLPEVYYIAAECYATGSNPDLARAMECLNTVREQRGIYDPLEGLDAVQIMTEIQKEYRKEFLAEGVMFYYYKRLGIEHIPDVTEPMTDRQYLLPYPDFEIQNNRVQ